VLVLGGLGGHDLCPRSSFFPSFPSSRPQNRVCHVHAACRLPEPDPQIAAAIAAMCGSRKTERPLAVQIRDRLGEWLADEEFAAAFGDLGRPCWSPSRLALVTILQRAEKLTDRLAADAARTRIDSAGASLGRSGL